MWFCGVSKAVDELAHVVQALQKKVDELEYKINAKPVYMKVVDGTIGYIYRDEEGSDPVLLPNGSNAKVKYAFEELPDKFMADDGKEYVVKAQISRGVIYLPTGAKA